MKTIEEFVGNLVRIEYVIESDCIGHYPFQLFCEDVEGQYMLNALMLGGDVAACYRRFAEYFKQNAKRIYMSLDFPKIGDIHNDFVAIISYENDEINIFAIPYENEYGKRFEYIYESDTLNSIKSDLKLYLLNK